MPRPEKVQAVAEIKERLERASAVFLAEYAGLSVKQQQALRRSLRAGGAEFRVVKMTLARLAVADLGIDELNELLLGPTGLTFADEDAVSAAKALRDFAGEHDVFTVKGGLLGRDFLTAERVAALADIEPRDVLLAKIAGAAKSPLTNLAALMAALPRGLATAMQELVDKLDDGESALTADDTPALEAVSDPDGSADGAGDAVAEVAGEEDVAEPEVADEPEVSEDSADGAGDAVAEVAAEEDVAEVEVADEPEVSEDSADGAGDAVAEVAAEEDVAEVEVADEPEVSEDSADAVDGAAGTTTAEEETTIEGEPITDVDETAVDDAPGEADESSSADDIADGDTKEE